jgi:hypothetical protein
MDLYPKEVNYYRPISLLPIIATSRMVSESIPGGVTLGIFFVATEGTMCPAVDSASKNECQGFLLEVKAAGA